MNFGFMIRVTSNLLFRAEAQLAEKHYSQPLRHQISDIFMNILRFMCIFS